MSNDSLAEMALDWLKILLPFVVDREPEGYNARLQFFVHRRNRKSDVEAGLGPCRNGWNWANAAEREELRSTPMAEKLRQTAALMESAKTLPPDERRAEEVERVCERWIRLRKVLSK